MKHICAFLLLFVAVGMSAQVVSTVTILPPAQTVTSTAYSFEQDGITVSCTKGKGLVVIGDIVPPTEGEVFGEEYEDYTSAVEGAMVINRVEESKNNEASHKILRNGVVLIEKDGKTYTMTGEKL